MQYPYIHGFSSAEQQRLTRLQHILNQAELDAIDLTGVDRFLDVGSGLGQLTRAVARRLPPMALIVGVEHDQRQRREAQRQAEAENEPDLVEFRQGRAENLPLTEGERGKFDMAHARFLLEHVPNPAAIVREMVSAVRAGGRIVLVDDDHELLRLWPECPPFDLVWREYWESYRDIGCEPLIGRQLPDLLHAAGAVPRRATTLFFGAAQSERRFNPVVDNMIAILDGAAESLAASGRVSPSEMASMARAMEDWRSNPGAAIWYSIPLVEGVSGCQVA